jgi:thioredoxin-like negative regulator of GroEL
MWRDDPELRLRLANERIAELRMEAAAARLARPCTDDDESARFAGVRIQLGRLLIMVGRMSADWAPPPSATPPKRRAVV